MLLLLIVLGNLWSCHVFQDSKQTSLHHMPLISCIQGFARQPLTPPHNHYHNHNHNHHDNNHIRNHDNHNQFS
jgi:hypothetical protein